MRIKIDYTADPHVTAVDCAFPLATDEGLIVAYERAEREGQLGRPQNGRGSFTFVYEALELMPGRYGLTIALSEPGNIFDHFDMLYKLIHFSVVGDAQSVAILPLHCERI